MRLKKSLLSNIYFLEKAVWNRLVLKVSIPLLLLLIPFSGTGQSVDLNQRVSFEFKAERLEAVLSTISQQYTIPFAYSKNFIPIEQRMNITIVQQPLRTALDSLFAPTKIIYAVIGQSIVLRIDRSKSISTSTSKSMEDPAPFPLPTSPALPMITYRNYKITPFLTKNGYTLLRKDRAIDSYTLDSLQNLSIKELELSTPYTASPYRELFQVTFVPSIRSNLYADSITNTFSLNVFWGVNGGVEGIELGGFGNTLLKDMKGLQIAGLWNHVVGDMSGTQFGSVFNYNEGYTRGQQLTLGANITQETNAIQIAGLMNIVLESFSGLQLALLANYARTQSDGLQMAVLFNRVDGPAYQQYALINKAKEIQKTQVGLLNIAPYVKGRQFGLINYAIQTKHTPIGLFSFVKDGFNRIEVGGGESLFANFGFKLGVRKFYNILHFGYRFTNDNWSLGYGIGTGLKVANRQHIHLEYVLSHVNEGDWWTKDINWLNQIRINYDWQIGKEKTSLYLGPTFNWIVSKIKNKETNILIGSTLPSYALINANIANANWKIWFGASAGIRF